METEIRYIAIALDNRTLGKTLHPWNQHDGRVYFSKQDALEFIQDQIDDGDATHGILGMMFWDPQSESIRIDNLQTVGFKGDVRNVYQLELFKD